MSAAEPPGDGDDQLLVVIDPVARRSDGESVRIAKDVLSAGAHAKICLPDTPEEFARALSRRGARRPVVVGDDHALLRAVAQLHRERELAAGVLSLIPVGAAHALEVAHALGVPRGAVAAARTALDGAVRRLDLLVDDSDGVVLGRLRIEADGVLLSDLDTPVRDLSVTSQGGGGLADVVVRTGSGEDVTVEAKAVTVSGADFRYRADIQTGGPVRTRTWTVRAGAWGLMLPGPASADAAAGARW
ncbi:diacylglycerol kinase family protein [Streptomyces parvus]|uniref:Diacylglycerol kinase n=1 Tax=Streptomyces parvus TaxID=66428 RepID=A0A5D4I6X9_9ACTN|nr:diacylglycerol kinase [Streptomyces parvus]KAA6202125.1 diacylglycerol kinase [Streptomyces parvus]TYR48462.1 diacylglycerol kinase [Streptomyces parvus]